MAFFGVTREKIGQIKEHEGADRLQIAKLEGINFQFVIGKDSYEVGDEVLYFPIDAVLPLNTAKAVGLEGKLAGKNKDRVKTVRLRGEISQGVVAPLTILKNPEETNTELITQELGVTKYDPPPVPCKAGKLVPLPFGMSAYDIEGAERNMDILEQLMDIPVVITEKLEGQNFSISWDGTTQSIHVNQRNYSIQPLEDKEHDFWRVAREKGLIDLIVKIADDYGRHDNITLYGEYLGPGVQGNIYKLQENTIKLFDLKINEDYLNAIDFIEYFHIDMRVPTVFDSGTLRKFLLDQNIVEASHGNSSLNSGVLREGIVIKPENEFRIDGFGRACIKQRDPIYLANEK